MRGALQKGCHIYLASLERVYDAVNLMLLRSVGLRLQALCQLD